MPLPTLAPRLNQVLNLLLAGYSEKQIARRLGLSQHTIHAYCKSLNKAFGAASRGELLAICYRMLLDDARRQAGAPVVREAGKPRRRRPHASRFQPGC